MPPDAPVERRAHLGPVAVVLELRDRVGIALGFADHAAVGIDQRDARARGAGHALDECLGARARPVVQDAARLGLQEPRHAGQARLDGLDREVAERVVQVEAGREHGDAHEADERQRQLQRDATPDQTQDRHGQSTGSRRYPTPFTVVMRPPSSPSLTRRRRTWTSTVRDSISPAAA